MKAQSAIFISKEGMATFWAFLAAAAIVGSGFYVQRQTVTAGLRPQFIIMGNADVLPVDPGVDPEKENEMLLERTRLMMDSIFNKSPGGLDAADRCKHMMAASAWDWVQTELIQKQADAFKSGRMHQKVEIESIDLHKMKGQEESTFATVRGQLIRTGVLNDRLFNEVWNVRAEMLWERNPSLRTSGREPTICDRFTCRETPVASTIRRTLPEDATTAPQASNSTPSPTAEAAPEASPPN
jgi:hypothetical protein